MEFVEDGNRKVPVESCLFTSSLAFVWLVLTHV
jgi:hypothetical protein